MGAALVRQVWRRADGRGEYYQLSEKFDVELRQGQIEEEVFPPRLGRGAIRPPGRTSVIEASDLGEFLAAALEIDVLIFLAAAIGGYLDLHPAGFAPEGFTLLGWRDPDLGTGLRHLLGDGIDAHGWPLCGGEDAR
jgi:hypothetical protein